LVVACSCRYCCREEEQDSSGILAHNEGERTRKEKVVVVVEIFAEGLSKIQHKCSRATMMGMTDDEVSRERAVGK
jgi:hypothetical protein